MATRLDAPVVEAALAGLAGWEADAARRSIAKTFEFKNFSEAFGFITRVALAAEAANHHPDWSNSYGKVTITLSTHSAGGVTDNDIALAKTIDRLAG